MSVPMSLDRDGCVLMREAVSERTIVQIENELASVPEDAFRRTGTVRFAIRHVPQKVPSLRPILNGQELITIASDLMEGRAYLVGATLFDKLEGANWKVPAHQDHYMPIAQHANAETRPRELRPVV